MACIINAESGTGLTNSADGSGVIKLQSAGKTTNALAWVNFNGTGTVAIRSSYNVSSITDNGTGDYTVNFATTLSDANYVANISAGNNGASGPINGINSSSTTPTTSILRVFTANDTAAKVDQAYVFVTVFGN